MLVWPDDVPLGVDDLDSATLDKFERSVYRVCREVKNNDLFVPLWLQAERELKGTARSLVA